VAEERGASLSNPKRIIGRKKFKAKEILKNA
jgi:hypothetical protein